MDIPYRRIQVLLVDDDEDDYTLVSDLLSDLCASGGALRWAPDYDVALGAIHSGEFDVCLLDYRMGSRTGLEFLDEAVQSGCQTPIIFLTDHGNYRLDLAAMRIGATDYLTKDQLSATLLERSIRYAMERRQKRDELFKAKRIIQALSECNDAVLRIKDEVALLRDICRIVVEVGGYRMAWVGYAEQNADQTVTPVAQYGYEAGYLDTIRVTWQDAERGRGPTGTCIRTGIPSLISSVGSQAEFAPWSLEASQRGYASVIGLPLSIDGCVPGALTIYASEPDAFDSEEVELLMKLSGNLSYGIEALRLHKARREAEESLRESYLELERRVEERTAELVKVNAELRKEVAERRQAEDALLVSLRFLQIVYEHTEIAPLLKAYVSEIKNYTGCDAVGIRVFDDNWNIPYVAYDGFSPEFYELESPLSLISDECMCINVIRDGVDPFYNEKGAFCVNAASCFPVTVSEQGKGRTRNRCNIGGYETVALFPICNGDKLVGLIHVADHRENMVPPNVFRMLEKAALQLGTALQRAEAESKLRENELKYRTLIENIPQKIFCKDKESVYISCNDLYARDLGIRAVEIAGRTDFEFFPRELAEKYRVDDRRVIETGQDIEIEEDYIEGGYLRTILTRKTPVRDDHGVVQGVLGVFTDITERKRAEEEIRENEHKYRTLFETANDGIFLLDETGFVDCNQRGANMYGLAKQDVMGRSPAELSPEVQPDGRLSSEVAAGRILAALNGAPQLFEWQFMRSHAVPFDVDITLNRVEVGGKVLLQSIVRDITERKRAEEERIRLATAIEQASEAICITDANWLIRYGNPAFFNLSGYDRSDLIGQHMRILKSGKHGKGFYNNIRETLSKGEVWSGRLINRKKDGTSYEVEGTASPVRNTSGAVINYVVIHQDITDQVKLEAELYQARKMEAIGLLAGGIAHDFNNILAAIMGFTELSLYKTPEDSPVRRNLEQVLKAASRASEVVKQILTLTRQGVQERKPVRIAPIVEEALKLLRSSLPSTIEIRREVAVRPGEDVVLADPGQIHQVLMNLSTNAGHAMRAKGGTLTVKLLVVNDASQLSVHPDLKAGPHVCITVSDTGHGMDSEVLERIFDPYFTTKGLGEGTGLGLSVVQGIVKSHGGAITVSSEPGQGTTFFVFLPGLEDVDAADVKASEALPTGSERILLVDDEEALVDLGKEILETLGYHVTAKTSSPDALETFRAQPDAFDLVITDMTMPSLTGRELAKQIIALRPDMPIILSTGFSDPINEKQSKEAGIREFVMKPYEIRTLAGAIRRALKPS